MCVCAGDSHIERIPDHRGNVERMVHLAREIVREYLRSQYVRVFKRFIHERRRRGQEEKGEREKEKETEVVSRNTCEIAMGDF